MAPRLRIAFLWLLVCAPAAFLEAESGSQQTAIRTQRDLFQPTKVWDAELTFTASEWKAIEPVQGPPTGRDRFTGGEWLQGRPGERNGWAAARGIHFNYGHGALTFDGVPFPDVAVRYKGNGTYGEQSIAAFKNSFKIDLNKFVKGRKLAGLTTLNFHNNINDPSWMNEPVAFQLYEDAGVAAPGTTYARLHLTVHGVFARRYLGLYSIVENVDEHFLTARLGGGEGTLLKPVTINPFSDLGDTWAAYVQAYDPKEPMTEEEQTRFIGFCRFVAHATDDEFAARIASYIDLDAFARYMAVTGWLNNHDSILKNGQNYYLYAPARTGAMLFIPWDQDASFGNFLQQPAGTAEAGDIFRPWPDGIRFLDRMWAVPEIRDRHVRLVKDFSETIFRPERFEARVANIARAIRPVVLDEPPRQPGGRTPPNVGVVERFDELAAGTKDGILPFVRARRASVTAQLASD